MPRTSGTWTSAEQARAARLGRGRLQRARSRGLVAMSVPEYRRRLRELVPEAIDALAAALKNPRERVAAAKVLLERAFPPSIVAAMESGGPARFTISFDRPGDADAGAGGSGGASTEERTEASASPPRSAV